MKKIIIGILLFFGIMQSSYAINSNDIFSEYGTLNASSSTENTFTGGVDYFVKTINIVNITSTGGTQIDIYDGSHLKYGRTFFSDGVIYLNTVFTGSLKIDNQSSNTIKYYYEGFYINEGIDINYNGDSEEDIIERIIDFIVLLIFVIVIWKIILHISYYFRK